MTRIKNNILNKDIGNRIKNLAKENGDKAEVLAMCLHCTKEQVSRYYNGHNTIPDDRLEILSKRWNVRKEYLMCEDDFKTNDDLYLEQDKIALENMQAAISYLKTLGLTLKPKTCLFCSSTALRDNFETLRSYIKKSSLDDFVAKFDTSLTTEEFHRKYFGQWHVVELRAPLPNHPFLCVESTSKETQIPDINPIQISDDRNILNQNYDIVMSFSVYYEDKFVRELSVDELQNFICYLDHYSRCTIDAFIKNPLL